MKKITVLTAFLFLSACAFAQKKEKVKASENYFSEIQIGMNLGKNNSGIKESGMEVNARGTYGWLYWQAGKSFPFQKPFGQSYEKMTQFSLGYGKRVDLDPYNLKAEEKKMELVFGIGPSIILIPEFASIPKKSRMYYGGSTFGVMEGNNFRAEFSATFSTLPLSSNYDLSNSLAFGEGELVKFFNRFGLGLNFKTRLSKVTERQVLNQPFNGYSSSETKSNLNPFVCYKAGYFIFRAGPTFKRSKSSWSNLNNPQANFSAWTDPIGFNLGILIDLKN